MNINLILNAASEVNLSIKTNSDLHKIIKKIDKFKPKKNNEFLKLSENESELLKLTQLDLNQLKKIKMIIQILRLGIKLSNVEDLKRLKEKQIENLIDIDVSSSSKIQEIYVLINDKFETLKNLKNKDKKIIVEQYNLMPPTTSLILFFSFLILVSIIFSYLGFSHLFLDVKYSYFNQTLAFWTMLFGGVFFLLSINYLFKNIFVKLKQIKDKNKIIDKLAMNFLDRREKKINMTILKLRKKQFQIESKSIKKASSLKLKEYLIEENYLLNSLRRNFILQ